MSHGATQFFRGHFFVCHGFDHIGTGHEHVGAVFHHENEIGHGRGVNRAAGARAHDDRDLRHHARGQDIALKHISVAAQRSHPLLDAGASGVIQADNGCAHFHCMIHDFADLFSMRFGKRAAKYGEILAEDKHHAPIDRAITRDHTITGDFLVRHAEIGAAVLNKGIPFFETTLIQQQIDPFTGGELTAAVLDVYPFLTSAQGGSLSFLFQLFDNLLHTLSPVLRRSLRFCSDSILSGTSQAACRRSLIIAITSWAASRILVPGP